MPELRWILLGLGVLFCLGLWWWETRRGRQAADSRGSLNPTEGLTPSVMTREPLRRTEVDEEPARESQLTPWTSSEQEVAAEEVTDEDAAETRDEPESPASPEATTVALERYARNAVPAPEEEIELDLSSAPLPSPEPDAELWPPTGTLGRIEPVLGDAAAAVQATGARASAPGSVPSPEEKIVTIRVAAPPLERFDGGMLMRALRAAGLEHGQFSIFHKRAVDGTTRFSVASLVEPGTFDLETMEGRRFPGVSMFAVLRDPGTAVAIVEEMLAVARALAANLHGALQDQRGAPLSPQRVADLRVEVATWTRSGAGAHGANPG